MKSNWATANAQNKEMVRRLQKDPEALEQVKQEMKKLQDLGFIRRLKDLPQEDQEDLNKGLKHFIPTTVAWKESSCSTKTRICWDSFRSSKESASLNSVLLKGSAEYSVAMMITKFRENRIAVSADIQIPRS